MFSLFRRRENLRLISTLMWVAMDVGFMSYTSVVAELVKFLDCVCCCVLFCCFYSALCAQ